MNATVLHLPTALSLASIDVALFTDSRTYARGVQYLWRGRVRLADRSGAAVTATVDGTTSYVVRLAIGRHGVEHHCTCPIGSDGGFCKHLVAVALAAGSVDLDDGEAWEHDAHEVLDAVEELLASRRRSDVLHFCELAGDFIEANAGEIRDEAAVRRLTSRVTDLRRRASPPGPAPTRSA